MNANSVLKYLHTSLTFSVICSADDRASNEELLVKGKSDSSTIATYTIKFYYTTDFARVTDDIDMFFSQVFDLVYNWRIESGLVD